MRMLPNFKDEATQYMRLVNKLEPQKIVAMAVNIASNVEMFEDVVGQMIVDEEIDYTFLPYDFDTSDYSNIALRAMNEDPDLYILSGYSFQIYGLMRALAAYGVPPSKIVVTMDFVDLIYGDTPREELAGYYFTTPAFEIPGKSEQADAFRERYAARFGATPSYVEAFAYDTAAMVVTAYKNSGMVNPETIMALSPFTGVTGTVTFDEFGDVSGSTTVAQFGADGEITEVE